jgi:hypothetical protein
MALARSDPHYRPRSKRYSFALPLPAAVMPSLGRGATYVSHR